jgi:sulfate adenylyltransferase
MRRAAMSLDATLLLHPVVGLTKPGDVDHFSRVRGYRAVIEGYFERDRAFLALLPLAMRMAGPREALWHGIVRRNHGASHFIVGRDHAGPGNDSKGQPFFGPFDAQELFRLHEAEIGVTMTSFQEMVYLEDEKRYEERDKAPNGAKILAISGTQVRDEYLAQGRTLPEWFTRKEVALSLAETFPPRGRRGFCVWFTGLSGAGKSVTAEALRALLLERGRAVTFLDGDEVRLHLSKGLGFSREDRDANILRIGYVASEVVRHGGVAICSAISPYAAARAGARKLVLGATPAPGAFIEAFVDTPIETCEQRDIKGLYAKARRGELKGFTGVDDPYEAPASPEVRLDDQFATPLDHARRILALAEERGFV